MLIIPVSKIDLTGLPTWFVIAFTIVYVALFVVMLGTFAYVSWEVLSTKTTPKADQVSGYVCSLSIAREHPEQCGGPPPEWVKERMR